VGKYHHVGLCAAHPFTLGIFELSLHQFSLEHDRDAEFGKDGTTLARILGRVLH
jgi:hypothetical protein